MRPVFFLEISNIEHGMLKRQPDSDRDEIEMDMKWNKEYEILKRLSDSQLPYML
jgi:hypothetical protein